MNKRTIAYTLLFIVSVICAAEYKANYNVFEMISFRTYYDNIINTTNTKPKVPAKTPTVYVHGHELLFETDMTGYSIELLSAKDKETVIYEDIITTDSRTYTLPENLSGEYIIRLTYGNLTFIGMIGL